MKKSPATKPFDLVSAFAPTGDQSQAIKFLTQSIKKGVKHQTLLGVTGSGKTFSMANIIAQINKPALVLAHNKTLAAQLYQELKDFFPNNAVEYFVSYYCYYQPEAYVPSTDTFIDKDSQINETIDRMRHRATMSLLLRDDVIVVSSVSCIYGIGSTDSYEKMSIFIEIGSPIGRDYFLRQLVESQYQRNDIADVRGTFKVRGDVVEIFLPHEEDMALRISFFGDEVELIQKVDPLRGKTIDEISHCTIFPASHYATSKERVKSAIANISLELQQELIKLRKKNRLLEAQRLEQRTVFDLEMLETMGSCKGIENYSRYLTGRALGEPPLTLIDFFPRDFLLFIDESHQSIPQVGGMYKGDRSRKETLVAHGFRLPSALDNRPLKFDEFEKLTNQVIYMSATPKEYEIEKSEGVVVEQLIRPTGLLDPKVEIRPVASQVDDVIREVKIRKDRDERVLVTTLTKRMAEDLTDYLCDVGIFAKYLHSDIDTLERMELLRQLRDGSYDVLIGINLLREGLDLPEVSLVAILDADKEGFLRSATGLIQTIGRAARNASGLAILYADKMTDSIEQAVSETGRRRQVQQEYNARNNITPKTIIKSIKDMGTELKSFGVKKGKGGKKAYQKNVVSLEQEIKSVRAKMQEAAKILEFEQAAEFRDQIHLLEEQLISSMGN